MDIARPDQSKARRKKRIIFGTLAVLIIVAITIGLARLEPAAPTVDRNLVWIDVVKKGRKFDFVPFLIGQIFGQTP